MREYQAQRQFWDFISALLEVTDLLFLHIEVVDDDTDEEVESEERAEDDEEDEVEIHEDSLLTLRLLVQL